MSPQSLRRCSQAWESVRYLRSTEALRMRCKDLVRPPARQRRYRRWTVVLRFLELQHSSKTQEFDETLELDLSYHENVGEALASVMKIDMRAPDFSYCSPTPSETSATLWCVVQRPFSFKPWELYTRIVYAVAVPRTISTRDSEIWRAYSFADGGKVNQASDAKGRAPGSAVRKPAKGGAKAGNRQYKQSPAPWCIPALVRALPDVLVFLEVFAGSHRLASTVAQKNHWLVLYWDLNLYDLMVKKPINIESLAGYGSGRLRGLHHGTPCNTFSRAPIADQARRPCDLIRTLLGYLTSPHPMLGRS